MTKMVRAKQRPGRVDNSGGLATGNARGEVGPPLSGGLCFRPLAAA